MRKSDGQSDPPIQINVAPLSIQRASGGGVNDAKVRAIIDDAMARNGYDVHKALSDVVALRNKPSKENCDDVQSGSC